MRCLAKALEGGMNFIGGWRRGAKGNLDTSTEIASSLLINQEEYY